MSIGCGGWPPHGRRPARAALASAKPLATLSPRSRHALATLRWRSGSLAQRVAGAAGRWRSGPLALRAGGVRPRSRRARSGRSDNGPKTAPAPDGAARGPGAGGERDGVAPEGVSDRLVGGAPPPGGGRSGLAAQDIEDEARCLLDQQHVVADEDAGLARRQARQAGAEARRQIVPAQARRQGAVTANMLGEAGG